MKKQTAVQWILEQYTDGNYGIEVGEQALKMEKEQIVKANRDGVDMCVDKKPFITGEEYYSENYYQ